MAKFIIEVSDEYIRERADGEKMAKLIASSEDREDTLTALLDAVSFGGIKKDLDNGQSEFTVSVDDMLDDRGRKAFNQTLSRIGGLFAIKEMKENKREKED